MHLYSKFAKVWQLINLNMHEMVSYTFIQQNETHRTCLDNYPIGLEVKLLNCEPKGPRFPVPLAAEIYFSFRYT